MPKSKLIGSKQRLKVVQSGIGFDEIISRQPFTVPTSNKPTITSRTARVLLAGAGFLADAYDLFVINLVLRLLRDEYPEYAKSDKIHQYEGAVAAAALLGSIIGQLVAGSLADIVGRKKIFVATAVLITIGSLGSALTVDTPELTIYGQIACWRFFLGAGVGGEYPLAATVTSESTSASRRGSLMAAVFAMQGIGALLSVLVVMACLWLDTSKGFTWRFSLAFGAVPVVIAFPWRLFMHETETFERVKLARRDASKTVFGGVGMDSVGGIYGSVATTAGSNNSTGYATSYGSGGSILPAGELVQTRWQEVSQAMALYKWHVVGTALSWFLLDVDFYANGLFNHDVTAIILSGGKPTTAFKDATNSLILCLMGIPGYWLSVLLLERIGRKTVQFNGFVIMGILFVICGFGHDWFLDPEAAAYRKWLFLVLYSMTFLFSNFGPNTTTFIIPGEIFPAEVKATCHGLSAASGKAGAAFGAFFFPLLLRAKAPPVNGVPWSAQELHAQASAGLRACMLICGAVAGLGAVVTYFFVPSYGGRELEESDSYIALDHACLQPSLEQSGLLARIASSKDMPPAYPVFEVVDSVDHYGLGNPDEEFAKSSILNK